jgi:glyoxylase-like metal-dependent hydrolase (beta-lactamase superfamily II)
VIVDRYGATVHVQSGARTAIERRLGAPGVRYRPPAELPGGVVAIQGPTRSEVIFWLPAHRTLVTGDVLHGDGRRGVRSPWLNDAQRRRMATIQDELAKLPVERILSSHGEPLLEHGRAALRQAPSAA